MNKNQSDTEPTGAVAPIPIIPILPPIDTSNTMDIETLIETRNANCTLTTTQHQIRVQMKFNNCCVYGNRIVFINLKQVDK